MERVQERKDSDVPLGDLSFWKTASRKKTADQTCSSKNQDSEAKASSVSTHSLTKSA